MVSHAHRAGRQSDLVDLETVLDELRVTSHGGLNTPRQASVDVQLACQDDPQLVTPSSASSLSCASSFVFCFHYPTL